ncbi:MAG: UbiX family flavin prenyltransferase [Oscillospiraceae bacterium]
MKANRLIIGMSGASGAILGIRLLEALSSQSDWESHLVISNATWKTIQQETGHTPEEVMRLADRTYPTEEVGASIASGTFEAAGMVVIPCSMKTLAGIHSGYSDNLLLRAADVTLKERRKLVLVARETPLSTIHLRNMYELSRMGAIIMPPAMAFYNRPETIDDLVDHMVGKVMACFGIEYDKFHRWK